MLMTLQGQRTSRSTAAGRRRSGPDEVELSSALFYLYLWPANG